MKNVVLLGATGSIGTSSVDVIHQHSDIFNLYAVAANSSVAIGDTVSYSPYTEAQLTELKARFEK